MPLGTWVLSDGACSIHVLACTAASVILLLTHVASGPERTCSCWLKVVWDIGLVRHGAVIASTTQPEGMPGRRMSSKPLAAAPLSMATKSRIQGPRPYPGWNHESR